MGTPQSFNANYGKATAVHVIKTAVHLETLANQGRIMDKHSLIPLWRLV